MKNSVIFYLSHYEAIKDLSDEQLGKLFRALFEKQLGNEVVLENSIKIAFNFINNQMVVDNEKYKRKVEVLRNNGKKGGAPKGNQNAKKNKNNQNNQIEKKTTLNVNDNVNVNVNDNDNVYDDDHHHISLVDFVERDFGRTLSPSEYEVITSWEDNDLTRYAIKKAILNGAPRIKYIQAILSNYKNKNIKTVQEAQLDDEKFKKSKNGIEPEWLDKEFIREENEDAKEFARKIREYHKEQEKS